MRIVVMALYSYGALRHVCRDADRHACTHASRRVCVDRRVCMRVDMSADMGVDVYVHMCVGMCEDTRADTPAHRLAMAPTPPPPTLFLAIFGACRRRTPRARSNRRVGDHFEYRHARTRAMDMPSAMPI